MKRGLIIIGAGIYASVAAEIAAEMGIFEKIDFLDDNKEMTSHGVAVLGTVDALDTLADRYDCAMVAIGNPEVRLSLLDRINRTKGICAVSLISPHAYVSGNAKLAEGCIVEPMAVVHAGCSLERGCIISAGAVVNHASCCGEGVHVDCNATVGGYSRIPAKTKIHCGSVFENKQ